MIPPAPCLRFVYQNISAPSIDLSRPKKPQKITRDNKVTNDVILIYETTPAGICSPENKALLPSEIASPGGEYAFMFA